MDWVKNLGNYIPTGFRGRVAGAGALGLGALANAAMQFGDTTDPGGTAGNAVDAAGAFGGTLAGGVGGAALAGMMGGGPIGALVLGSLAAALGGEAGKGLTRGISDAIFQPDPRARELQSAQRAANLNREMKVQDMKAMLPLENQYQQQQIRNQLLQAEGMAGLQRDMNYQNALLAMIGNQANLGSAAASDTLRQSMYL